MRWLFYINKFKRWYVTLWIDLKKKIREKTVHQEGEIHRLEKQIVSNNLAQNQNATSIIVKVELLKSIKS